MTKESKSKAQDEEQVTATPEVTEPSADPVAEDTKPASEPTQPVAQEKNTTAEPQNSADKQTNKTDADTKKPEPAATKPTTQTEKKSGNGVAVFALLIAAASLAFSAWHYTQPSAGKSETTAVQTVNNEEQAAQLTQLQEQLDNQTKKIDQFRLQLAELPSSDNFATQQRALKQMQSAHQAFTTRFESAFGNTRQDWRLAEAEHLLRMAILRLSAMQDLNSALHLVEGADQILFEQDDIAAYPARDAIAQALADIKAMPKLDRAGLFMRLGALQRQVNQLDQLMPGFDLAENTLETVTDSAFWRQWLDQLSSYVRLDFNSPDDIQPLLSSQEITHIRLAISLAIEQAQWGALNGQQQTYDQAIQQGLDLLKYYFSSDNQTAQALTALLNELVGQPVSQSMPDIKPALLALQAYIQDRTLEYRTRGEVQQ
ncbi:MAG: uroporphyrinogen-III C-methyltransferase [Thiopseudomonas sp.]|nr:uroporphyrinogen-III C-methyltransferase [Thiopseudomonas sp.]MCK9465183.1 uroporphyrinogen-III C-methyltransferase [Thiopseudomonas sp.]